MVLRLLMMVPFLMSCSLQKANRTFVSDDLNITSMMQPIAEENILRDSAWYNWGTSIIKGDDNKFHLFYSRWPRRFGYGAWITHSEIAHAISDHPAGPYHYIGTVAKGRGGNNWDAITAHNPKLKRFNGKYYLYYIATHLDGKQYSDDSLLSIATKTPGGPKKNPLRMNQRSGVMVATSLYGPWERFDEPLIQPSGPIENITVNPDIEKGPDGCYYLIVKGDKPNEEKFIRDQAMAVSESPVGPFVLQAKPVIDNLDTEDISIWYSRKQKHFYSVFHAHTFIGMISSADGLNWEKANNYVITEKKLRLSDGSYLVPDRMERPFVFVEDDKPVVLSLGIKKGDSSFCVFVPLR